MASVLEWTVLGVHLTLGSSASASVFWVIIGCLCFQPTFYYLFTVYFACFSHNYPNWFEKIFNVAYLYTLYVECLLFKLEPLDLKPAFENDGMTDLSTTHRKQMLLLHLVSVSIPAETVLLYSGFTGKFDTLQIVTVVVIGLAAICYFAYCLPSTRIRRRYQSFAYYNDDRIERLDSL